MAREGPVNRARLLTLAGLALYTAVLIGSPFAHHDLACHLKNPQHCSSCASSQLGSELHTPVTPSASHLSDAGCVTTLDQTLEGTLLAARTTGRSPPPPA
jgi:hypothetical protein